MGYYFSLIGAILAVLASLFSLGGVLLSPGDNIFYGPRSLYQKIIQKQDIQIKDSPGAIGTINVNNSPGVTINIGPTQREVVSDDIIFNGATIAVTNKLVEIAKLMKEGKLPEAETMLRSFEKDILTNIDLTNIQSVRAAIYMAQGKFPEAKAIYESILDTDIKSNAVYSGLGTIAVFEAFKLQKTDPQKAISLLYTSNDWYFQALDVDKRPQALVTLYFNIYDNFRILTQYFYQPESINTQKYKELFLEYNELAGKPYLVPDNQVIEQKFEPGITKAELESILKSKGLNFDISGIPDNVVINSYRFNGGSQKDSLNIEYLQ